MSVLYVTTQGAHLRRKGDCLVVRKAGADVTTVTTHNLDAVLVFGRAQVSTDAARLLLERGIETTFLTRRGRLIGHLTPPRPKNVLLRIKQVETHKHPARSLALARAIVAGKLAGAASLLTAFADNHTAPGVRAAAAEIRSVIPHAKACTSLDSLRGIEGAAARRYFSVVPHMCLGELPFAGRTTRPPRDPMNALLSFGYVLVASELQALLDAIGFDPYVGFYHDLAYGRASLALDLLEEFRHPLIDRFVLSMNNLRVLVASDFETSERDGCRLRHDALRRFFVQYEKRLRSPVRDPATGDRVPWRELFRRQAERLAAAIRFDQDYTPHCMHPSASEQQVQES